MSQTPPVVLTGIQRLAIQEDARYANHWIIQSLLLTLSDIEATFADQLAAVMVNEAEARSKVQWFEATYGERAFAPLLTRKSQGSLCPTCGEHGGAHIGPHYCCLDCGATWEQEAA